MVWWTSKPGGTALRIGLLCLIVALALGLRLRGLGFGLPALLDPDEPIFVLIGLKLLKQHTLDPGWFGHPGTITIYTMALVEAGVFLAGHWTGRFPDTQAFTWTLYHDPGVVFLPGRAAILLFALATIVLAYRLARCLFDTRVALLTALLLAIDPIHIRYSQIIRTDMQATVFVLLALLAAIRIAHRGRRRDYIIAGIWLGVGCATKWPSATAAAGVLGAAALRAIRFPDERGSVASRLGGFVAASLAACVAASPYLVLDFGTLMSDLHGEERPIHLGATGYGFLGNIGWYLVHPLRDAMGRVGVACGLAGLLAGGWRRPSFGVVIGVTAAAFLISISVQHLIWERWVVPLLPLFAIGAAWAAVTLVDRLRAYVPAPGVAIGAVSLAVSLALPPLSVADAQAAERATDTRRLASDWARRHIPAGSTVAIEYLAFDALAAPWRFLYPAGDEGCVDVRANLARRISVSTIGTWRRARPIVDFGGVDADHAPSCRADYIVLANYDRYLAERDRFPGQIVNYRRLTAGGRTVAIFRPRPGKIGGPVVRIVRLP